MFARKEVAFGEDGPFNSVGVKSYLFVASLEGIRIATCSSEEE